MFMSLSEVALEILPEVISEKVKFSENVEDRFLKRTTNTINKTNINGMSNNVNQLSFLGNFLVILTSLFLPLGS